MKRLISSKKKNILGFLLLIFCIFVSNTFINLYFLSTLSPDYDRYSTYLGYFLEPNGEIFSEQGVLYYFVISVFIFFNINKFNISDIDHIENLGNSENLNIFYTTDFEKIVSVGIQNGNLFLFLIGLYGVFRYLKINNMQTHQIYILLSFLIFFPPALQMRLTLKPEILGFALLPWLIYYFTSYVKNKNKFTFFKLILIVPVILTAKASVTAMVGMFLILLIYQNKNKIQLKEFFLFSIIAFTFFSILLFENQNIINRSFFEREDLKIIYNQTEYDNVADPEIFYTINFVDLLKHPESHYHSNSVIGITLIDTFGDYFNEYWDKDYTLSNKHRKEFIVSNDSNKIDFSNRTLYFKNWNFSINHIRNLLSVVMSAIFYMTIVFFIVKNRRLNILLVSPFIGILVLIINSLGFPEYNFYPETADTFKTFYYSFLLSLCFIELIRILMRSKLVFKKYFLIIYITLICFIVGFPKGNNTELDNTLSDINKYSTTCNLNRIYLSYSLIENNNLDCEIDRRNEISNNNIKIRNYPAYNLTVFSMILFFIFTELELINHYLKKIDKYLRKIFSIF